MLKRQQIRITGTVQGVGFRPAVYRLAQELALVGFVYNDSIGVVIEVQGPKEKINQFVEKLKKERPPLARIKNLQTTDVSVIENEKQFIIKESRIIGNAASEVTADIAVCQDCLSEMNTIADFRCRYPFINCTNCGPRYSIVKTIPYDRCNTTMSVFKMCRRCSAQYSDVADRRFHAQPIACGRCGPKVWLADNKGKMIEADSNKAIEKAARLLRSGKIVAIKGIGGFHLAVDALNEKAVQKLRQRKKREHKPFALMTNSIERIKKYAVVSIEAEKALKSPQCPIVLMPKKKGTAIAPSVAEGTAAFGFMLCYAPLHYLLFSEGLEVLVMTSGNISDEPLICNNQKAVQKLGNIADAFLMHNRDIYRQVDDSIVHFIADAAPPLHLSSDRKKQGLRSTSQPVLLRRARGFVPTPITSDTKTNKQILAAGADLKNTFCLVKGNQLILSEHIGDLEDAEVFGHYIKSIEHFRQLFEFEPEVVVCDLHPNYLSTQYALSKTGVEKIQVQHHWAHIASVLAEHNMHAPVIGLAADGTGYGTDGAIWGCECLIASLDGFQRFGHLDYYLLAGADKAGKEAIRPVLGLLKQAYNKNFGLKDFGWLLEKIEPDGEKTEIILKQIEKQINTVQTSSLGRIFDAVATILGLGSYNHFEAQLPMALESIVAQNIEDRYDFEIIPDKPFKLDLRKMVKQIIADIQNNTDRGVIAAKFHNCLASGLAKLADCAREKTGIKTVAISGGVFCNRYLANRLINLLRENDFAVLFNKNVPANDGGISLGQAAIAARKTKL
jgi:hydrogenase maturation protein HypF